MTLREEFYKPKIVNFSMKSTRNLDTALNMVLNDLERVNEYDYNCMLHEFKSEETMLEKQKKKHFEYKKQNRKWKENLENMYKEKDNIIKQKQKVIVESMRKKKKAVEMVTKLNEEMKQDQLWQKMQKEKESNEVVKSKVSEAREINEEIRLKYKEKTEFNLHKYTLTRSSMISGKHERLSTMLSKSQNHFSENLRTVENESEEKHNLLKEKRFEKFERLYLNLRKLKTKKFEEKEKQKENDDRKEKNRQEIEKKRQKEGQQTNKKLKDAEQRRHELEDQKKMLFTERSLKTQENTEKVHERKRVAIEENDIKNLTVMDKQMLFLSQSVEKDMNMTFLKQNVLEKSVVNQMELEKKLKTFYGGLDELKEKSVSKKNSYKRRAIWDELKYQERLRKEKEREEELRKLGLD